jgi:methanogenic corrinoid protein MtbC1
MPERMRTPLFVDRVSSDLSVDLASDAVSVSERPDNVCAVNPAPRRAPTARKTHSLTSQSLTAKLARAPARRKSILGTRTPDGVAPDPSDSPNFDPVRLGQSASGLACGPVGAATDGAGIATPGLAGQGLSTGQGLSGGLAQTIEGEVIPRLMLALKGARPSDAFAPLMPTDRDIAQLAADVLGHDETAGLRFVDSLLARGMALEMIYIHLIAPAARRLGQFWIDDAADFTAVTIGLGRLQQIVRRLSPAFRMGQGTLDDRSVAKVRPAHRSALIAPDCGEQHTLGCVMVEDFFTRSGWAVTGWPLCRDTSLVDMVRNHHFDLVGLSVGCDSRLGSVAQHIAALRRASRNRSLLVMVGGRTFSDKPTLAPLVGADGTGASGCDAVQTAELMMTRQVEGA